MKRIILIILALLCNKMVFGQFENGDGSLGNPYSGTLTENYSLSGTVYINGDIFIDAFTLTIQPGTTINLISDDENQIYPSIIVSQDGSISAIGTKANPILFTTQSAFWGHIIFESGTTASSTLEYCIIEKGDATTSYDTNGGAISCNFNGLTISNSILRDNSATNGGGIHIGSGCSPVIQNSVIINNTASRGGGIYFNSSGNSKIFNCSVVMNLAYATTTKGSDIYYRAGGTRPQLYNVIVWGSTTSLYAYGTKVITDFNNCAIQGYTSGYSSCISLSSVNNDATGPNFVDVDLTNPENSNLNLSVNSPCIDMGVTTSPALPYDFAGNARIGNYDIGAYENQYSRWTGNSSTEWGTAENWLSNILPSTSLNAVIPDVTNDPVISLADVTLTNLVIETGGNLTIGASRLLTVTSLTNYGSVNFAPNAKGTINSITNNGSLLLESEAAGTSSGISSLIIQNYSGNNPAIELYLPAQYHYISSPFSTMSATTEIINEPNSSSVMEYRENLITNNMNNGWVTTTGYHFDVLANSWVSGSTPWSAMSPGAGYNYYSDAPYTYNITGSINTANQSINLVYNTIGQGTPDPIQQGYNLLGNPFTSSIDWDNVVSSNGSLFDTDVSPAIYFRQSGATIVYLNGVTTPSTYNSDGSLIPPMQGFFVKSNLNNASLTIPSSARVHTNNKRYKGTTSSIPLVRLQIDYSGKSDQTVVRFDEKATTGFDNNFDAYKIFPSSDSPSLSSSISGVEYSINGIPYPESSASIPLAVNAPATGSYSINAKEIVELTNYKIYLKDNLLGRTVSLNDDPIYTFSTAKGKLSDRFVLEVTTIATSIPENTASSKPFNIFYDEGTINIQVLGDEWDGKNGNIRIFDLSGKVLSGKDNVYFEKGNISTFSIKSLKGIYIVEIKSDILRFVGKTVLN
ncbi:MAG TPA: choice-of-anchor Q domain-containing protein [Bacteroidales bacterium]|nr:choice-of-anchor Q domain-containing protein [Bacteroidales bacterium]